MPIPPCSAGLRRPTYIESTRDACKERRGFNVKKRVVSKLEEDFWGKPE
jgi:hypothetical protein